MVIRNYGASFWAQRVNASTWVIIEDDKYGEHTLIYAKIYEEPPLILISDTGCDAPSKRSENAPIVKLRDFLERFPVENNASRPLNPNGEKQYVVICTHCHYDHIGGIDQLSGRDGSKPALGIVASAFGKDFIEEDIWEHSICKYIGLPKPEYHPTVWAKDKDRLVYRTDRRRVALEAGTFLLPPSIELGIVIFATPGHTPDELAWYDMRERHLYVGDSFYDHGDDTLFPGSYAGPIEFPKEGDWTTYMMSMRRLLSLVRIDNQHAVRNGMPRIKVGSAHVNIGKDAETSLQQVVSFFERIVDGEIVAVKRQQIRGEEYHTWEDDRSKMGIRAPVRLLHEYRQNIDEAVYPE